MGRSVGVALPVWFNQERALQLNVFQGGKKGLNTKKTA